VLGASIHPLAKLLTFHNVGLEPLEPPITVIFRSEFEDAFEIRDLLPAEGSEARVPSDSCAAGVAVAYVALWVKHS